MTREEAIYELLNAFKYNVDDLFMDACNIAIEALREPQTIIGIDIPYGSDKGVATIFKRKDDKVVLEEVKELTGNTVEVVRCKDCKHCEVLNTKDFYAICNQLDVLFEPFEDDTRTHFCAWGERSE